MVKTPADRNKILNAFRPGSAIDIPAQFAGRKYEIETLVDTLHADGACPIVYGERGLGKTSLALQIERIALGDTELLDELSLPDRILPEDQRFTTFFFFCSDGISSKDELLQRLINTAEGFDVHAPLPNRLDSRQVTTKISLKFFEQEVQKTFSSGDAGRRFESLSVEEKFEIVTRRVVDKNNTRVLYIIDELDRLKDSKGLASLIKNLSSRDTKFLLVGVGQSVSTLLHDHASLERTLVQVPVYLMGDEDSSDIIHKTESLLAQSGFDIKFSENAIKRTVEASGGFPWFVHTIAQEALKIAYGDDLRLVGDPQVNKAIGMLSSHRFGQQFYDTYQMAVGDSRQREVVLRLFAKWSDLDLPSSELYPLAHDLRVANPAALVKQLMRHEYGGVLVRPPYAPARVFRFTNAMFKRYVNLSNSVYIGVGKEVDEVWKKHIENLRQTRPR